MRALPVHENYRSVSMTDWLTQSPKDRSGGYSTETLEEWLEKKNGLLRGRRFSNFYSCHHIWLQLFLTVLLMTSIFLALAVMT